MSKGRRKDERIKEGYSYATSKYTKEGKSLYDDTPPPFTNHICIVKASM